MRRLLWDLPSVHAVYIPFDVIYSKSCSIYDFKAPLCEDHRLPESPVMQNPIRQLEEADRALQHSTSFTVLLLCFSACRSSHRLYIKLQRLIQHLNQRPS